MKVLTGLGEIDPRAWDALTGDDDPFVEHAFLSTLEQSGAVGDSTGWIPLHLSVWDAGHLVGALPLYLKQHSYGEYIFDWGWADAAERMGMRYYPKLVSMAPVTPATGRRLLVAKDADYETIVGALVAGLREVAELTKASSIHLLFITEQERNAFAAFEDFLPRLSMQFHWHGENDATFDDYLARFRSSIRKQIRRERRKVADSGLDVRMVPGSELTDAHWKRLGRFYRDTCDRKGSYPYLPDRFFEIARHRLAARAVSVMAFRDGNLVAATLNFEKGANLYGRYWGCSEDYEMLHFELCYYRLIERAIETGATRFEAGAQGSHKLRRGLMPSKVHSVHWIRDPVLRSAVGDFCRQEAFSVQRRIAELSEAGPFKRG